jgi:hypothetical protein
MKRTLQIFAALACLTPAWLGAQITPPPAKNAIQQAPSTGYIILPNGTSLVLQSGQTVDLSGGTVILPSSTSIPGVLDSTNRLLIDQFGEPAVNWQSDTQSDGTSTLKIDPDYGWVTLNNATLFGDSGADNHIWSIGPDGSASMAGGNLTWDSTGDLTVGNSLTVAGNLVSGGSLYASDSLYANYNLVADGDDLYANDSICAGGSLYVGGYTVADGGGNFYANGGSYQWSDGNFISSNGAGSGLNFNGEGGTNGSGGLSMYGGIVGSVGTSSVIFNINGTPYYPHVTAGVLTFTSTP